MESPDPVNSDPTNLSSYKGEFQSWLDFQPPLTDRGDLRPIPPGAELEGGLSGAVWSAARRGNRQWFSSTRTSH